MSVEVVIEFERECYKCYGTGGQYTGKGCERCDNTGRVPTELGEKLLEFLEHQKQRVLTQTEGSKP
jgi:hypothetical protein